MQEYGDAESSFQVTDTGVGSKERRVPRHWIRARLIL